jgi:hypothetical protein
MVKPIESRHPFKSERAKEVNRRVLEFLSSNSRPSSATHRKPDGSAPSRM